MTRAINDTPTTRPAPGAIAEPLEPGIAEKVAFLRRPTSYPESPAEVTTLETHMSWVFLTDRHAWKLRKPVDWGYLDFSTAAARRRDCDEEVRLNQRLTRDVYLGVVPLTCDADGALHLDGVGEPIDWLVKMRRLPADLMLDESIRTGCVHAADVARVVSVLARAYREWPPVSITPAEYRRGLSEEIAATATELALPDWALPSADVTTVSRRQRAFLDSHAALFEARVREGRIVEGHGDLRPEHICLEPEPQIIDCLEFDRSLRVADAVDELTFLALECERLGAPQIGSWLLAAWRDETGDAPPTALVHFYASYRAAVRVKIAIWHWHEPALRGQPKWHDRACEYLRLAAQHSTYLE